MAPERQTGALQRFPFKSAPACGDHNRFSLLSVRESGGAAAAHESLQRRDQRCLGSTARRARRPGTPPDRRRGWCWAIRRIALAKIDQVFACWAPACRQGPAARVGEPFDLRLPQLVRPLHRERGQTSARRHALPLRGRRQLLQLHIPHHSVVESFHSLVLVVVVAGRRLLPASRFHEVGPSPLRRRALDLGSLLPSGAFSNAAAAQRLRST